VKINKVVLMAIFFLLFFSYSVYAIFCSQCGTKNNDSAKFCTDCGAKLTEEGTSVKNDNDLGEITKEVGYSVVLVRTLNNELNAQYRDVGSGFIVDPRGYILTNTHLFDNPEDLEGIRVLMFDKKEYDAKILLCDYSTDIALLKIEAQNLTSVKMGDSSKVIVGEKVFAIGNPIGLEKSATSGIVSAKNRFIEAYEYEGLVQTDAAINPGNSGGPLFNMQGEVVGITSLGYSKLYTEGLNFAIPIDLAKQIVSTIPSCKIKRAWMGIAAQDITPTWKDWEEATKEKNISDCTGAIVVSIVEGKDLPVKKGDIIVKVNKSLIKNLWDLQLEMLNKKIGEEIEITVKRNNKEEVFHIRTTEKPDENMFPIEDEIDVLLGCTFIEKNSWIVVDKVRSKSLAEEFAWKPGDGIEYIMVNQKNGGEKMDTNSKEKFYEAFRKAYDYKKKILEIKIYFTRPDSSWGGTWHSSWREQRVAMHAF